MNRSLSWVLVFYTLIIAIGLIGSESSDSPDPNTCCTTAANSRNAYSAEKIRGNSLMADLDEFDVITKTLLLDHNGSKNTDEFRSQVAHYFQNTFDLDASLFMNIKPEYAWVRADPLRHPPLWYAAHSAVFYINKLRMMHVITEPLNSEFESRFAIGVDEMSWDDQLEDRDDWPTFAAIFDYRQRVRRIVLTLIETFVGLVLPVEWDSVFWVVLMCIEHERIHIETSSVLLRQLPIHAFVEENHSHSRSRDIWHNLCQSQGKYGLSPKNELIAVESSHVNYGRTIDDFVGNCLPVYGWDIEYGEMTMDVPAFRASKYLVSNEEYYEFVLDNGYATAEYWTHEGWRWQQSTNSTLPKFWRQRGEQFYLRTVFSEIELPWNWPVITNQLEAVAFTNWKSQKSQKSIRLLTEDEWHALRNSEILSATETTSNSNSNSDPGSTPMLCSQEIDQPYWDTAPGNINFEYFASEAPVDMFEFQHSGFFDLMGNVWQHTLTFQHPFDGYRVQPVYDDFSTPVLGTAHNVIKGGSWISTGNEAIAFTRIQFRRHFFQFAGIRYVESARDTSYVEVLADNSNNQYSYSTDSLVSMYIHFHYWDERVFGVENYAKHVAHIAIAESDARPERRRSALDIGCAVGRTAFELATVFESVVAIDITARLISVGYRMQEQGFLEWVVPEQGDIQQRYRVTADELGYDAALMNRVHFVQNDAQNMAAQYTAFDLIVACNLIDRINNPRLFLTQIHQRLNVGGTLVLLDPFTWMEEYTPKERWLGAKYDGALQPIYSEEAIKEILLQDLNVWEMVNEMEVEFVIRETIRKYQHTIAHCMIFRKIREK